jgi:hypothetical protein
LDRLFQQIDFQELQSDGNFKCIGWDKRQLYEDVRYRQC